MRDLKFNFNCKYLNYKIVVSKFGIPTAVGVGIHSSRIAISEFSKKKEQKK